MKPVKSWYQNQTKLLQEMKTTNPDIHKYMSIYKYKAKY